MMLSHGDLSRRLESEDANFVGDRLDTNQMKTIVNALVTTNRTRTLTMAFCSLGDEGASDVARALLTNRRRTNLERLCITNNGIGRVGGCAIGVMLRDNSSLRRLDLGWNELESRGVSVIADALRANRSLRYLRLNNNENIGGSGIEALADALSHNRTLISLNLNECDIDSKDARRLAEAFSPGSGSLEYLHLRASRIDDGGIAALSAALERNVSLTVLALGEIRFGAPGAKSLALGLGVNKTLKRLGIDHCMIGDEGMGYIFAALVHNRTLERLDASKNDFGVVGAKALAKALRKNSTLLALDVSYDRITDEGGELVAKAMEVNDGLVHLDMSFTGVGKKCVKAMMRALRSNTTLISLSIPNNSFDSADLISIAEAMETDTKMLALDVVDYYTRSDEWAGDGGRAPVVAAFTKMIQENDTLVSLGLNVDTSVDVAAAFFHAYENSPTLLRLGVAWSPFSEGSEDRKRFKALMRSPKYRLPDNAVNEVLAYLVHKASSNPYLKAPQPNAAVVRDDEEEE